MGKISIALFAVLIVGGLVYWKFFRAVENPTASSDAQESSMASLGKPAAAKPASSGISLVKKSEDKKNEASEATTQAKADAALAKLQNSSRQSWEVTKTSDQKKIRTLSKGILEFDEALNREDVSKDFIAQFSSELFQVDPNSLKMHEISGTERTKYIYKQDVGGVEIYGATLGLVYEGDKMVRVQNDLIPASESGIAASPLSVTEVNQWMKTSGPGAATDVNQEFASQQKISSNPQMLLFPSNEKLFYVYKYEIDRFDSSGKVTHREQVLIDAANPHVVKTIRIHID